MAPPNESLPLATFPEPGQSTPPAPPVATTALDFSTIDGHQAHPPDQVPPHSLGQRVKDFWNMEGADYYQKYAADDQHVHDLVANTMEKIVPGAKEARTVGEKTEIGKQLTQFFQEQMAHPEQFAMGGEFGGEFGGEGAASEVILKGAEGAGKTVLEAGRSFAEGAKEDAKAVLEAKTPAGRESEAGRVPLRPSFDSLPGHETIKPAESPHEPLPRDKYVYHATDKSRADSIRQTGVRPKSWYANSPEDALRSGAVPISGNRADLRMFAVPKAEIEPVTPDVADIGAREVEKGRFVMSGKSHQPIEVDHSGRPYEAVAPKAEKPAHEEKPAETAPDYKSAAEKSGVEFRGVQEGIAGAHPGLAIFQDPKSTTSVAVRLDQWSPEKLQERVDAARERMNPKKLPQTTKALGHEK